MKKKVIFLTNIQLPAQELIELSLNLAISTFHQWKKEQIQISLKS